jgi:acetyltransferase
MTVRHLDRLLTPGSVAVIGASDRSGSVGHLVWSNLRSGAFQGPVYAVNRRRPLLMGEPAHASVAELPQPPDLAVVCTPPDTVPGLVAELGALGTRAVVVLSAGLSAAQKQACLDAARPHVLRLLGPNCLGLMTPRIGLNATFAHAPALPGELAFVSQSGALVTAMIDWANARRIGFSQIVSLGERIDVDFGDLLDHLASDPHTRAILLYIESIEAPRKFMSAARAAARNKPVIVVKAGRSESGRRAAASHTGALAGADVVFDAAIRRAGMLRVDTLDELFIAAQTLARFRGNNSDELTVMTNGGGGGVLAADAAARLGVTLHQPDAALLQRLDAALPANWSHDNPVDIIGDAPVERYVATLQALLDDRRTGAVLFMHAPTAIVPSADIARACAPLAATARDRVLSCWLGDAAVAHARNVFAQAGIADYATPEEAVRAFALLRTYRHNQRQLMEAPAVQASGPMPDTAAARELLDAASAQGREWLDASEVHALLRAYHIGTVAMRVAPADGQAAVAAARGIGHPVALKLMSPDITHKTEIGGVRLQLRDDAEVARAAIEMLARAAAERPHARIDGLLVQQMVERPLAQELIVGASIDEVFGPVVLFGHGGIAVEVLGDRAVGLPPLNRVLARELIDRTRVAHLLAGYRNRPPARIDAVIDVLVAVSCMLADLPQIAELDINPLLADAQGAVALDARVRVSPQRAGGAARFAIRPYPQELIETVAWQGETLTLRPIRPEDEGQHLRFIEQLSPEDVRLRVFVPRRDLPRSELARLTQIDYAREMAFIAERRGPDGAPETLGTVRAVSDPDGVEAEFAIVVRTDLKGRGLGRLLMDKLERYATAQGLQRITGVVLRENESMLDLARHMGFVSDSSKPRELGVVALVRELQPR